MSATAGGPIDWVRVAMFWEAKFVALEHVIHHLFEDGEQGETHWALSPTRAEAIRVLDALFDDETCLAHAEPAHRIELIAEAYEKWESQNPRVQQPANSSNSDATA